MNRVCSTILPCCFVFAVATAAEPKFERQVIDDAVEVGYGLAIGDVDGDGKPDILLADKRHFSWYKNPGWEEFPMVKNLTLRDNVSIAAADINGDGQVEVAVGARWNPGETAEKAKSGSVHYLVRPKDPTQAWKPIELNHDPTVHRMRWVKADDNQYRLVVLPLHGIGNKNGEGENGVNVRIHFAPLNQWDDPAEWKDTVLDDSLHKTHNFDDRDGDVLIGGAEGVVKRDVLNPREKDMRIITPENSGTEGVGEVRFGSGFIAAIEPMHGNQLVVYENPREWVRTVLTDQLNQGHALATGDLLGLGSDQIVVGWRNPDPEGKVGIRIFHRAAVDAPWKSFLLDDNQMATEDLKLADLDGDGKLDVIAAGRATKNLVIYWNRSE
ncbi:MAG: hypothetical protein HKN23_07770 [Verrucomicrobiales bacterium]|nr:hypothetical protein [Verrucomicrobiales bacterium]